MSTQASIATVTTTRSSTPLSARGLPVSNAEFLSEYAVSAPEAWARVQAEEALLVDVRSAEELKVDGAIPGAQHVAWLIGPALLKNVRFIRELEKKTGNKQQAVILICRSGVRSFAALEAARKAGFADVSYVPSGIEGRDEHPDGWRRAGLPMTNVSA